jgi:hypothetical protein
MQNIGLRLKRQAQKLQKWNVRLLTRPPREWTGAGLFSAQGASLPVFLQKVKINFVR